MCPVCRGYTGDAGLAVTAGIPVKFGIAHDKSVPEVGSAKRIGACARKGVPLAPQVFGTSKQIIITPTGLLRPIHNFCSVTICSWVQYLQNNSKPKICSHRLQCQSVIPISIRFYCCMIKIRQTRILSISSPAHPTLPVLRISGADSLSMY